MPPRTEASLGDLMVALLASTLACLRDRLYADGFEQASDLVADLVDIADHYLMGDGSPDPGAQG